MELPGVEQTDGGLAFQSGVPYRFPWSLWHGIFGRTVPVALDGDGVAVGSKRWGWEDFSQLRLLGCRHEPEQGGRHEPEQILLEGADTVCLFRTQATIGGKRWNLENLRQLAVGIAEIGGLEVVDALGDEESWSLELSEALAERIERSRQRFGALYAGEGEPFHMFDEDAVIIELEPDPELRTSAVRFRLSMDEVRVGPVRFPLSEVLETGVTFVKRRVPRRAVPWAGAPARARACDLHEGTIWVRVRDAPRRLASCVVGRRGPTPGELHWVASRIASSAEQARERGGDRGSMQGGPDGRDPLRDGGES